MKKQIYRLILLMVPIMFLFSCKKDKFTEKDALDAQQTIDVLVTVVDGTSNLAPVPDATVTAVIDSTTVTKTTNANGVVVFTKVKIGGNIAVSVAKANFTSVLTSVDSNPISYRQTQVSSSIKIYSLDPAVTATFKGRLTMQSDLTDRNREPAVGVIVKARNFSLTSTTQVLFTATTDADGKYSIAVPVTSNGDIIEIYYPEITVNQKIAFSLVDKSAVVLERSVVYKTSLTPLLHDVPSVPSVFGIADAPSAPLGTGFALGAKATRTQLDPASSVSITNGGAGYNGGVTLLNTQLSFSPDPNGVSAKLQVDIVNGKISNIDGIINNGATYAVAPTLNLNVLAPTTPAVIAFSFQVNYKIYVTNKGSNYLTFPTVAVETESYVSGSKVKGFDPNINDANNQVLGANNVLTNWATIYGGLVKANALNGDTLFITPNAFSSVPVFTVAPMVAKRALLSVASSDINADSTLRSVSVSDGGAGYNPLVPPAITFTTVAGYGSGATAKATVNSSGSISGIIISNPGSKYVKNVNDFKNDGINYTYDSPTDPTDFYNGIKAGDVTTQDVYYGTGYQLLNQSTGK